VQDNVNDSPADDRAAQGGDASADPSSRTGDDRFSEAMQQQHARRDQLRYVREFLNNPLFIDLSESVVDTSSEPDEIEARKQDLRYRVSVLDAILTIFNDELKMLDKITDTDD
jgi:hypothetical protein